MNETEQININEASGKVSAYEREALLTSILDDSNQMIQLSEMDSMTMLYANQPARVYTGHANQPYIGEHCYKYMMGLDAPCPFCPLFKMDGEESCETEVDNGKEVYAVKTKKLIWNGKPAFIEYAWDITEIRRSQQIFESQVQSLLKSIPEAEGIMHMDVADDVCISLGGIAHNMETFQQKDATVDETVRQMASFAPDKEEQKRIYQVFCRDALICAYANGKAEINLETSSYFDDGTVRPARITARLLMNPQNQHLECILYGKDTSEEVRAQQEYENNRQEQFSVINTLAKHYQKVYLIDLKSDTARILKLEGYITSAQKKQLGSQFRFYHMTETYIRERVHPDDRKKVLEALKPENIQKMLDENEEYVGSYRVPEQDGMHYYQFRFIRMHDSDQVIGAFQNIDTILREEKERQQTLALALDAAEQANRAKTQFLNSMSHDIRTPMNAIIGFTALAGRHINDREKVRDYLSKISTSSSHLLSLINDVLDMSRIESGKVKIEEKDVHLPDVFHDLRSILQSEISARGIDLLFDTMDVVNEDVVCDRLRLNQIMLNLLSNAVKFTNPGGTISVKITQKHTAPTGYANFEIRVKDTGIGMSKDFCEHVFEAFERERTSTVSGIEGTGLGMAITKNIVDMMGGTIRANSEVGKGSEFIVNLQFRISGTPVTYEKIEELQGVRALMVDDDMDACCSVCKMLGEIGLRSDWTTSGREAVVRARFALESDDAYGVYIIDWIMPDMNGIETIRRIRQEIGDATPIIILTAYDWTDVETEARALGVTAFCSKPLFMSELREVLSEPFKVKKNVVPVQIEHFDFTGRKILVVEDNILNQEITKELLEEAGFMVDVANDGDVAVSKVRYMKKGDYDVILMDIQMPKMDGYTATSEIRTLPNQAAANLPIIALTANAFEEDRRAAINAGMDGHMAKPLDINTLLDRLKEILK